MNEQNADRSANAGAVGGQRRHDFTLRQVRIPSLAKSLAFAFLLVASALILTGCPGTYYERGYGSAYYAPTYGNYYGRYGYTGVPYAYSGLGVTSISIGGVRHRRHYGRHHYYGTRHHYGRGSRYGRRHYRGRGRHR